MSTLTHSPSPVASPCNNFNRPPSRRYSPKASPRQYPANSPRRASNAPTLSPRQIRGEKRAVESGGQGPVDRGWLRPARYTYVDCGTQYSPEGYPPTAASKYSKVAPAVEVRRDGSPPTAGGARSGARKRKEPSVESMSGTPSTGSSSGAKLSIPSEPNPRIDPIPSATHIDNSKISESSNTATSPQGASQVPPEPQEARSAFDAPDTGSSKRPRPNHPGTVKIMPRAYETCNPRDLGVLISNMLMELIRLNDQIPLRDGRLTRFHSRAPPGISVSDYLQRLIQHATLSPPILLSMVYYIDRLCALYPAFTINSLTVHRFLITAATVAAKGLSDSFWTNPTYARIGGIPVSELATLELEFLQRVQWKIVPRPEVLVGYYESLIDRFDGWELERSDSDTSSIDESERSGDEDQPIVEEPS